MQQLTHNLGPGGPSISEAGLGANCYHLIIPRIALRRLNLFDKTTLTFTLHLKKKGHAGFHPGKPVLLIKFLAPR